MMKFLKPAISKLFEGKSTTVFSIGGAGSGKTYSLQGVKDDPGMVPMAIFYIFKIIEKQKLNAIVSNSIVEVDENGSTIDLLKDYEVDGKYSSTMEPGNPTVVYSLRRKYIHQLQKVFIELSGMGSCVAESSVVPARKEA